MDASDLHLVSGFPPTVRIHGELQTLTREPIGPVETLEMLRSICPEKLFQRFSSTKNLDFAPVIDLEKKQVHAVTSTEATLQAAEGKLQRFRANYFFAGSQSGACFRVIPRQIPDMHWAGFPESLAQQICEFRNGLVLFTGVTGSGKSTSLAMMIKRFVQSGGKRIVTIEEPIEYVFDQNVGSLVTQREVGEDVETFADGLKYGLRQDPDVMLVGEIRDLATAQIALSAAETGHLIFATMHTRDAKGAISRFTDLFPQSNQYEVRSQLAFSLRCVVSQHLLPSSVPGEKRELALEVLFNSLPMAAAIRNGKIESIDNNIQTGKADGMFLLDDSIAQLLSEGRITRATAERFVSDKRALR